MGFSNKAASAGRGFWHAIDRLNPGSHVSLRPTAIFDARGWQCFIMARWLAASWFHGFKLDVEPSSRACMMS